MLVVPEQGYQAPDQPEDKMALSKPINYLRTRMGRGEEEGLQMWKDAEKKLKNKIEAKMHFYCEDDEICTRYIRDKDLQIIKRRGGGGGRSSNPEEDKEKEVEELRDEKARFKKKNMMLDKREERLGKEQELLDCRAVQQTEESIRLSDGVNVLNKEKKKVWEVGVDQKHQQEELDQVRVQQKHQQEKLDQVDVHQKHQQEELDQIGVYQEHQQEKLDQGGVYQEHKQDELEQVGVVQKHKQEELEKREAALAQKEVNSARCFDTKEEELGRKEQELTRKFENRELELMAKLEIREFQLQKNLLLFRREKAYEKHKNRTIRAQRYRPKEDDLVPVCRNCATIEKYPSLSILASSSNSSSGLEVPNPGLLEFSRSSEDVRSGAMRSGLGAGEMAKANSTEHRMSEVASSPPHSPGGPLRSPRFQRIKSLVSRVLN